MVYNDTSFLKIREEFPNLEKEVRSLLLARAQDGATIAEIRDDYYKLTGVDFPIGGNITEYFLSIPNVVAYCTEHGARIFNILPLDKTKHLYNMILNQKSKNDFDRPSYNLQIAKFLRANGNPKSVENRQQGAFVSLLHRNASIGPRKRMPSSNVDSCPYSRPLNPKKFNTNPISSKLNCSSALSVDTESKCFPNSTGTNCRYNTNCNQQQKQPHTGPCRINNHSEHCKTSGTNDQEPMESATTDSPRRNCVESEGKLEELPAQVTFINEPNDNEVHVNVDNHMEEDDGVLEVVDNESPKQTEATPSNNYRNNMKYLRSIYKFCQRPPTFLHPHPYARPCSEQHKRSYFQTNHMNIDENNNYAASMMRVLMKPQPQNQPTLAPIPPLLQMDTDYDAHYLDFLLLGDDFFLYMARMELGCKFRKNQRVLQSGLCVSGQRICAAVRRINQLPYTSRHIIVNIGSVDIMQGRRLIQIEHDFRELVTAILRKGLTPILTTLAPLANYIHNHETRDILTRFNEFIKREGARQHLITIDIWGCLVNEKQQTLFDCFQIEPRIVTGTTEPYVFWNKVGRQRVLRLIESHLEY